MKDHQKPKPSDKVKRNRHPTEDKPHVRQVKASDKVRTGRKSRSGKSPARTRRPPKEARSSVSFGNVQVREFERIVGDNPGMSDYGPPLGIGWRYYDSGVKLPVESFKMTHGPVFSPYRRNQLLPLQGETRRIILENYFDVSRKEIRAAMREVARTKQQRSESMEAEDKFVDKVQGVFQSAKKHMRRQLGPSPPRTRRR